MSLNVRLLRRVKAQILKEPKQFIMSTFFSSSPRAWAVEVPRDKIPNCGTAACIGGWAVALAEKSSPSEVCTRENVATLRLARRYLGLSRAAGDSLFITSYWGDYSKVWDRTWTLHGRAKVAAAYIDAFIEKYQGKHQRRKKVKHG